MKMRQPPHPADGADAYAVEPREGTALGGFVTFAVYPLSIVFILMLFAEVKRAPPAETRDILWTSQEAGSG